MDDQISNYVLDSYALLAFFQAEIGGPIVRNLIERAQRSEVVIYLSLINLGEIYYITWRNLSPQAAESMLVDIQQLPIIVYDVSREDVMSAARLKAQYPISFCDAFAASLALNRQATCVTGDPEFQHLQDIVNIQWLPRKVS